MNIRKVQESDAEQLADLLNYYVQHTTATFHQEPLTVESRREWAKSRTESHPGFVLESTGRVLGVCGLKEFRAQASYARTVESMVYLRDGEQGRGYGTQLMRHLIAHAKAVGHHAMVAVICPEQDASIRVHRRLGFEEVGRLRQVGRKFDRWLDSVYMELLL